MFYRLKLSTAGRVDAVSLNPEILKCSDGGLRTMLPLGRYPGGWRGRRRDGGGNTADIENALPSAFTIPGIFFGDEGPGLGIPEAESGKKKRGREKSYSTVQRRWISLSCNGRENRLACLVNGTTPCTRVHARAWVSLLPCGREIISHSHFSRRNQYRTASRNIWLAPALINFPGLILKVRTITRETYRRNRRITHWYYT